MLTARALSSLSLLVCTLPAVPSDRIQAPDAPWMTLTTTHYRIHYPDRPAFSGFAREVASKIEGIHALLEKEIGFGWPGPTDVVIQNPMATPNGMVLSDIRRPTVTLWTEPLTSDTEISESGPWIDVLVLHELVHLHHLTRHQGKPPLRWLPLASSRLSEHCPPWIAEGYATYLEGRLTGRGRPHGAQRAMVMRQLAREGRLPSYVGLSGQDRNFPSSLRYQAGSAFMEWLAEGHLKRDAVWPDLWQRMASKQYKTFNTAFKATFGDQPEVLYSRYRAELTHSALDVEKRLRDAGLREGVIWNQAPDGHLCNLSVSPDGTLLLAQAATSDQGRMGLQIYALQDKPVPSSPSKKRPPKPEDAALPPEVTEARRVRTPQQTLALDGPSMPTRPLWEPDGTISYQIRRVDGEGVGHLVSRRWQPRSPKPTQPTIVHAHPVSQGDTWVVTLAGRTLHLPFEPYGPLAYDTARQLVYVSTPIQGIYNVVRCPYDPSTGALGQAEVLTRTAAGALYPAPTPDGKELFYVQPSGWGSQIRRLDLTLGPLTPSTVPQEPTLFVKDTVIPKAWEPNRVPPPVAPPAPHPYRVADSHHTSLRLGVVYAPSASGYQLGMGGNDVLGRLNWVAMAAIPQEGSQTVGPRGGMLGGAWRGWSWSPSLQLFSSLTRPSRQAHASALALDVERRGAELAVCREWWPTGLEGRLTVSAAKERVELVANPTPLPERTVWSAHLDQRAHWNRHLASLGTSLAFTWQTGHTDTHPWHLTRGEVGLSGGWRRETLHLHYAAGRLTGDPQVLDRFNLGGLSGGILPRSLEANSVFQAALPSDGATGTRFERWRASYAQPLNEILGMTLLKTTFQVEGTRLWDAGLSRPAYLRVASIQIGYDLATMPPWIRDYIQRHVGRLAFHIGLHRPLDGVMKDRTVLTVGVIQRF